MKLPEVSKEELKRHSKKYITYSQRIIDALGDGLYMSVIDGGLVAYNYWGNGKDNNIDIEIFYNEYSKGYQVVVWGISDRGKDEGFASNMAELEELYHQMKEKYYTEQKDVDTQ